MIYRLTLAAHKHKLHLNLNKCHIMRFVMRFIVVFRRKLNSCIHL